MGSWTCPHGFGPPLRRGDCEQCNADLAGRPPPIEMSGDERAAEVEALLELPHAYRFAAVHERIEGLVGRPVWTHEFVTLTVLVEEARGVLPHPDNPAEHALRMARVLMEGKPVITLGVDRE